MEISQQCTLATHTEAVQCQGVLLGVFHPCLWPLKALRSTFGGRVAKPLFSPLTPVPTKQLAAVKINAPKAQNTTSVLLTGTVFWRSVRPGPEGLPKGDCWSTIFHWVDQWRSNGVCGVCNAYGTSAVGPTFVRCCITFVDVVLFRIKTIAI